MLPSLKDCERFAMASGLAMVLLNDAAQAQVRSSHPSGSTTSPISRTETRPNLGAGSAYGSSQDRAVRTATDDGGLRSAASGSRVGTGFGATFDQDVVNDVIVDDIAAGSAAARAGLQPGDTIVSLNDRRFRNPRAAMNYLARLGGERVNVTVLRDGALVDLDVDMAGTNANVRPGRGASAAAPGGRSGRGGMAIRDLRTFGLGAMEGTTPAIVANVAPGSLASEAGIRAGDRIVALGGRRVETFHDVDRILSGIGTDPALDITVDRNGRAVDLTANLARYTGYYSTIDHDETGTTATTSTRMQFGNASIEGLQSVLGATFGRTPDGAMTVTRVVPNSYAAEIGLQRGDVLYGLDGQPLVGTQDILRFFGGFSAGDDLGIYVWRDGQSVSLPVAFDQAFFNRLQTALPDDGQIVEKLGSAAPRTASRLDGDAARRTQTLRDGSGAAFREPTGIPRRFNDLDDRFDRSRFRNRDEAGNRSIREETFDGRGERDQFPNRRPTPVPRDNRLRPQSNPPSARIDTPETQNDLEAAERLRDSFWRGPRTGIGQPPMRRGNSGSLGVGGGNRGGAATRAAGPGTAQQGGTGGAGGTLGGGRSGGGASGGSRN